MEILILLGLEFYEQYILYLSMFVLSYFVLLYFVLSFLLPRISFTVDGTKKGRLDRAQGFVLYEMFTT